MTQNKLYHGKGRVEYRNGEIYQGEFENGRRTGRGTLLQNADEGQVLFSIGNQKFYSTGQVLYTGTWKNGLKHGTDCTETWNAGHHTYTGDFVAGVRSGRGKYQHNGSLYEGEFERGLYHGQGKYYDAETGKTYVGQFANNLPSGKGVMVWPDGSRYEGNFVRGKMEGSGT